MNNFNPNAYFNDWNNETGSNAKKIVYLSKELKSKPLSLRILPNIGDDGKHSKFFFVPYISYYLQGINGQVTSLENWGKECPMKKFNAWLRTQDYTVQRELKSKEKKDFNLSINCAPQTQFLMNAIIRNVTKEGEFEAVCVSNAVLNTLRQLLANPKYPELLTQFATAHPSYVGYDCLQMGFDLDFTLPQGGKTASITPDRNVTPILKNPSDVETLLGKLTNVKNSLREPDSAFIKKQISGFCEYWKVNCDIEQFFDKEEVAHPDTIEQDELLAQLEDNQPPQTEVPF